MKNEIFSETGFYSKKLTETGTFYCRTNDIAVKYPDVLFFCLYSAKILNIRKVPLETANKIKNELKFGDAWEKILDGDEDAPMRMPITVMRYKQNTKYTFSASMLIRKKIHFRIGYFGFGFFTRKRQLSKCAEYSVFAMLYTLRELNRKNDLVLQFLWQAANRVGSLEFGAAFNQKNCMETAQTVYRQVTSDLLP